MKRGRPRKTDKMDALHGIMLAFWQHGFTATSMNELVEASGMAKPSLYAAFGDKEGMFEEALTYYFQRYGGDVLASVKTARQHYVLDFADLLRSVGELAVDPSTPLGCFVFNSHVESAYGTERHKVLLDGLRQARRDAFKVRMLKAVEAGEMPEETDVDSIVIFIDGQIGAVSVLARAGANKGQIDSFVDMAIKALPVTGPAPYQDIPPATLRQ